MGYRLLIALAWSCGLAQSAYSDIVDSSQVVRPGESRTVLTPHHQDLGGSHNTHFFSQTFDAHHFAWFSSTPGSPSPITVLYDFRSEGAFANEITTAQRDRVIDALDNWTTATNGKLQFVQNTTTARNNIINIGTGNLAAVGSFSAPGGVLGVGGGFFDHSGGLHAITGGIAWQDFAETWDTTIGNGNPAGTFDYFTVAAQEIGHALGLGHTPGAMDIMNGTYNGERTLYTASDLGHIQSVYGLNAIPEPSGLCVMLLVGAMLGMRRRVKPSKA